MVTDSNFNTDSSHNFHLLTDILHLHCGSLGVNGEFLLNPEMSMGNDGTPSILNKKIDVVLQAWNLRLNTGRRFSQFHRALSNRFLDLALLRLIENATMIND